MHIFDRFHIRQLIQAHFLAVLPDWQERPELNAELSRKENRGRPTLPATARKAEGASAKS